MVPGSNLARHLAGLRYPTLLQGSQRPSGRTSRKLSDLHQVGKAVPLRMSQSWPWDSQIATMETTNTISGKILVLELWAKMLSANQIAVIL